jgi:hypothetical protein
MRGDRPPLYASCPQGLLGRALQPRRRPRPCRSEPRSRRRGKSACRRESSPSACIAWVAEAADGALLDGHQRLVLPREPQQHVDIERLAKRIGNCGDGRHDRAVGDAVLFFTPRPLAARQRPRGRPGPFWRRRSDGASTWPRPGSGCPAPRPEISRQDSPDPVDHLEPAKI